MAKKKVKKKVAKKTTKKKTTKKKVAKKKTKSPIKSKKQLEAASAAVVAEMTDGALDTEGVFEETSLEADSGSEDMHEDLEQDDFLD